MKIRQKKLFEKKIIGEFWETILKIFEKMVKKIHLFSKNQKIVKKRVTKKVEFTEISKIFKKRVKKWGWSVPKINSMGCV